MRKEITVRQLPNFINGKFVETGNTFDVLYPITGEVTAQAHTAGKAEVDAAVAAARAALNGPWGAHAHEAVIPAGLALLAAGGLFIEVRDATLIGPALPRIAE